MADFEVVTSIDVLPSPMRADDAPPRAGYCVSGPCSAPGTRTQR